MKNNKNVFLPLLMAIMVAIGMFIGSKFNPAPKTSQLKGNEKINYVLHIIEEKYFDTVNINKLSESAIASLLEDLDPHSYYIPPTEIKIVNQDLGENFEGIGIEFNILRDTIIVVSPIAGGPSESVGVRAGDRIVEIDGKNVASIHISTDEVRNKLLGKKGTPVSIKVFRPSTQEYLDFTIIRDKIPFSSLDASYMINETDGYIKINRFSSGTDEEFRKALVKLKEKGMKNLILDLSGNPGGYLNSAFNVADEFFNSRKLIVYTQGRKVKPEYYYSSPRATFGYGKLVIIIDEGSASASEIVAGAIQDWDRGILVGRRSFGKGLVQEQFTLPDNSALRLTVARYYTPSGRCIQKPFESGKKMDYYMDIYHRFANGEFISKDSVKFPDSLIYKTKGGRKVYGGGGIMPDIFVGLDTSYYSPFYREISSKGIINTFILEYATRNREKILNRYPEFSSFQQNFDIQKIYQSFLSKCRKSQIRFTEEDLKKSGKTIQNQLKALLARNLYGNNEFYQIINQINEEYLKAIDVLHSGLFEELGIKISG